MIKTLEELSALPKETPIRDVAGVVWERADLAAQYVEYGIDAVLPAVQLIPATINRGTLSLVRGTLFDFGVTEKYMDRAVDALLVVFGLGVSDE